MLSHLPKRGTDAYGSGDYGASRGHRKHRGQDFACYPGTLLTVPFTGVITKLGYAYADDLSYRYVQVTDREGLDHRVFYVNPHLLVGDIVTANVTVVGEAQDICERYSDTMTNHVHYEVKDGSKYLDPRPFIKSWIS